MTDIYFIFYQSKKKLHAVATRKSVHQSVTETVTVDVRVVGIANAGRARVIAKGGLARVTENAGGWYNLVLWS